MADYGGQNISRDFNVPSPYQTEQRRIQQQQKMAEMLQAQSMQPNERFSYNGIEARIPATAGLAKMLQGFTSMMMQKKGLEEEKALGEKYRSERMGDMSELISGLNAPAVAGQAEVPARPAEIAPEERAQAADYGTPLPGAAIPAVMARAAGQIDPLMMGRMKTSEGADQVLALVMAQRQAQLEAERRANEPFNLTGEQTRFQPVPGGVPKVIATGVAKTPFAPLDVSKFTPESLALAMKPDGTVDRTLLRAIPERATGELGVYNEYVRQQTAAGKIPMGIDQFIINQKIAGRTPAVPRERSVYDTTRGGVVNLDTSAFTPAMQGGKPIGPAQSPAVAKEVMGINQQKSTMQGAINAVNESPSAFGFKRGAATASGSGVAESIAGRFDTPQETEARAYVFNNVSAVIKERAGTAQSAQELTRINSFLPGATDNAKQITNKLNGYLKYLDDLEAGTVGKPTKAPEVAAQTPIYANAPGKPKLMSTDGGKTWKEAK